MAADGRAAVFSDGGAVWRVTGKGQAVRLARQAVAVAGPGAPGGERLLVNDRPRARRPGPDRSRTRRRRAPSRPARRGRARDRTDIGGRRGPAGRRRQGRRRRQHAHERSGRRDGDPAGRRPAASDILTLNADLKDVDLSHPRPITHAGPNGAVLTSRLYLPPGLPDARRAAAGGHPLSGGYPAQRRRRPGAAGPGGLSQLRILAGAGYAVLLPSLPTGFQPGTDGGYGRAHPGGRRRRRRERRAASISTRSPCGATLWRLRGAGGGDAEPAVQGHHRRAASPDLFVAHERDNLASSLTPDAGYAIANATGWLETGQARMGAFALARS